MSENNQEDLLEDAKEFADRALTYWGEVYDKAKADLYFLSDDEYAQWDPRDADARRKSGKPILTIDQLSQFVNQVSNDVRMNTPSIDIIPADGGDEETAEIIQGLVRKIEADSNADEAYDNAVNFAIKSSIGFIRVDHGYIDDESFDQSLFIKRVINPCSIYLDPDSIEADGSDAKRAIVLDKLSEDAFGDMYPDKQKESFSMGDDLPCEGYVTIAEYFYIEETDQYIYIDSMGDKQVSDTRPEYSQKLRKSKKRRVRRCKLSGCDVLEDGYFAGEYIPIVPVYGEEAWIDGKRNLLSLIRRSKDAQRMNNYWASLETELLMKAPKAPVIAVEGTVEDFAEDWTNPDKSAVLRYKQKDSNGMQATPPQFMQPIQIPMGIVNARQQTVNDIKATMGLYDSFLGQQDNAISGVAINGRQREGDRATFHYGDNLVRAITQVGRIIVSAMPEIYDTPRYVQLIGKEDTNDIVGINGAFIKNQDRDYDLTKGKYSVSVTTGASYATMRQEATEFFERVVMNQPQLMPIVGDLVFKYADFAGAQAMSERIKKTIDPKLLDEELDPQTMALQAQNEQMQQGIQMLESQIGQLQQALMDKEAELSIKAQSEVNDKEADNRKYEIEIAKIRLDEQKAAADYDIKTQELEIKAFEAGLKTSKIAMEQRKQALTEVGQLSQDANERGLND